LSTYEAMFLLDDARCNQDYDGTVAEVKDLLVRNRAQVHACEKWDQRRLCYPIKRRNRATYVLVHFDAPPDAIQPVRAACALSPSILRVLILIDRDAKRSVEPQTVATAEAAPSEPQPAEHQAAAAPDAVEEASPPTEEAEPEPSASAVAAEQAPAEEPADQPADKPVEEPEDEAKTAE